MIVKTRTEPRELRLFRALNSRMDLSTKDETYYSNLEKGYQGELQFDEWLLSAAEGGLILNDLLLEMNNLISNRLSPDHRIHRLSIRSQKLRRRFCGRRRPMVHRLKNRNQKPPPAAQKKRAAVPPAPPGTRLQNQNPIPPHLHQPGIPALSSPSQPPCRIPPAAQPLCRSSKEGYLTETFISTYQTRRQTGRCPP